MEAFKAYLDIMTEYLENFIEFFKGAYERLAEVFKA